MTARVRNLVAISRSLAKQAEELNFAGPVDVVYNPLNYARGPHEAYLTRYGGGRGGVLLVGMNPGPFGMVQTGVPFGDVSMVRDWLGLEGPVGRPAREHPKRPVLGFGCTRAEVSGTRLWRWAKARFVRPERFFKRFFVYNYCPLAFLEASGRNLTPDRLAAAERAALFEVCDLALSALVRCLQPAMVVGVGAFAHKRVQLALSREPFGGRVGLILHPSPASPAANRGWAEQAEQQFAAMGVVLG